MPWDWSTSRAPGGSVRGRGGPPPFAPASILRCWASSAAPEENLFSLPCDAKYLAKQTLGLSCLAWLPHSSPPHSVACHSSSCKVFSLPEVTAHALCHGYIFVLLLTLGTSSTNTVAGTVNSQAAQAQPPAMTSSRKGTFTDDLHKLVDNWARDAMNLSGRRGSKGHMNYEVNVPFLPFFPFVIAPPSTHLNQEMM